MNVLQNHNKGAVWISQQNLHTEPIKKLGLENAKSTSTPVNVGVKLTKATYVSYLVDQTYQSELGGLLHMATKTRPDVFYAVSKVAPNQLEH